MGIKLLFFFCLIDIAASRKGFPSQVFTDEKYDCPLANKKIYTVKSEIQCTHRCLQNDACELINYNTEKDVKENCEIFTQVNECSTKVIKKRWIAMRFQHQRPPKVYKSCKEIYNDTPSSLTGVYELEIGKHFCLMGNSADSCGQGGWTLALKVDGRKRNFMVTSPYWTNDEIYNVENGTKSFYEEEAKFPAFGKVPFNDVCIGMKVLSHVRWLRINGIQKESLVSLFKSGNSLYTNLHRSSWKNLIASSSLQLNCRRQGFNVKDSSNSTLSRIGYVGNDEADCINCDSFIGIGPTDRFSISCGNAANGPEADKGWKKIPAMCYVLIQ